MPEDFPENLDDILQPWGDYFLDELCAAVAVHALNRLGERRPSRLSTTMLARKDFLQGYLVRLIQTERDAVTQGFDDRDMLKHVSKIDPDATLAAYRTMDRVYPMCD